ncbi:hypothetical protein [Floridanema aerugineum]|uniref:Uncharacterized protein n=1 Tax=Floridaenema aerugineum BLCC-F46 TaxID=3153654 RepID=A0ABV4X1V6_9CYAN
MMHRRRSLTQRMLKKARAMRYQVRSQMMSCLTIEQIGETEY